MSRSTAHLYDGLANQLVIDKFADFEIYCGGHVFKVHRVVLSASSQYFDRLCSEGFKEAVEGRVTVPEHPALVARMLLTIYTGSYPTSSVTEPIDGTSYAQFADVDDDFALLGNREGGTSLEVAELHAHLYAMGVKYSVDVLKSTSREGFLKAFWNHEHGGTTNADDANGWHGRDLVSLIYTSTPPDDRGLRDIIVHYTKIELADNTRIGAQPARVRMQVRDSIAVCPDFGYDLATTNLSQGWWMCTSCFETDWVLQHSCACINSMIDGICQEGACVQAAYDRTFCGACQTIGQMRPYATLTR